MTLRLEAFSPTEGIGIVRAGQTLRLIRPPYLLHDAPVLPEESLQDAILRHDFSASGEEFRGWEEAIAFLNKQVISVRRLLGKEIPQSIQGSDILDSAPPDVLSGFLDRVEEQLIPQRLFDHAENFLLALLASSVLTRHPEFGTRAARLLQVNKAARDQAEARESELACRDLRFPSLERRGEVEWGVKQAEMIRARGCVFAFAS